jgi:[acyl-carrier-protein] S-malonyltransferase
MAPVAAELATALAAIAVSAPRIPVVANVDAALNADATRIPDLLTTQVTAPVRWAESMRLLQSLGCGRALEVGPGQVLAKILQRMKLGIASASLEDAVGVRAEARA